MQGIQTGGDYDSPTHSNKLDENYKSANSLGSYKDRRDA